MVQAHENQEEIQHLLDEARRRLRQFEDRVDWGRLLTRLRTASPAHPILLARLLFGMLAVLASVCGLVVLLVPFLSPDLARQLAKFESVIPYVPEDVPALPAVFGVLAACMVVAWAMSTGAALAIGRESKLLPWEQKQHQALVNEITRLTAVQRIRSNTPATARPRIATPAPASMRSLSPGPLRTPTAARGSALDPAEAGFGFRRTPTPAYAATPSQPRRASPSPQDYATSSPSSSEDRGPTYAGYGQPTSSAAAGGFGPSPRSPSPAPVNPGAVPALPPMSSPSPIAGPPPRPLSATPRMGAPDVPLFDESDLDEPRAASHEEALAISDDDAYDPTSPDILSNPQTASWDVPPSRQATAGGSAESQVWLPHPSETEEPSLEHSLPLVDFDFDAGDDDLDGPDDIEIEQVSEVEMIESSAIHPAHGSEPPAPRVAGRSTPGATTDGPVVYDPAAVRESPAQPQQVRRPDAPSDATTLRAGVVVPPPDLLDLPDAGPAVAEPAVDEVPKVIESSDEDEDDDKTEATAVVTRPGPAREPAGTDAGIAQQGILARARASDDWTSRATPIGSAGRIRPGGEPQVKHPRSTRGGTPLGAPPQETGRRTPSVPRTARDEQASKLASLSRLEPEDTDPDDAFEEDEVTVLSDHSAGSTEDSEERWVSLIVAKAQTLSRHLPAQAQMAFSQEPHLPFTLVIARATPTVAVRAMMSFVEFLANIPTPPRARIELVQVSHLDRSFHRNVQAALEPHFDRNVVVEPQAGRVDIQFTDPDPRWGRHPRLPA